MKEIVDKHYSEYYKYYRRMCLQYYNGRYLSEDLLHELYFELLKVKPETVEFFDEIGKLHYIGLRIIKSLFYHKNKSKTHSAESSPLFETPSVSTSTMLLDSFLKDESILELNELENEIQRQFEAAQRGIEQALSSKESPDNKTPSDYLKVRVFLDANETNIHRLSKTIGVNRAYIKEVYKQGQELLKQKIHESH